MPTLNVALNGTSENPFHRMGLRQNPFTQLAQVETNAFERVLNQLGADPIPADSHEQYIRDTLKGFSDEFVDLCVSKYRPGEYVRFTISFPDR